VKNGWQTKTIGDVCEFQRGLTYAKGDEVDVSDNVVLRATNIDLATNRLIFDELKYINDKVIVPESKKVKKGALMICTASGSKSHLGKVALIDEDYGYAFGGFMGMLTPQNGLLPKYLFHLMTTEDYKDFIGALSDGANINNLTFDNLKRFPVPFPPLDEQKRIVAKLDEAFVGLAKAKENSEKNLQNARALFESHLESIFTQRGKGRVETTLGQVIEIVGGSQPPKSVFSKTKKVDNIRLIQIRDYKSDKYVVFIPRNQARRFCNADDVMIGRYGPPLFQILRGIEGAYNVALMKAVPDEAKLSRDFLFYFLKHSAILQYVIYHSSRAAGQIGVTKETLEPYPIALPPLVEQRKVVETIQELETETQRLTRLYEQKLEALESLKKSVLHEAFSGNL
jgi:type I restriction enzyme S subunit